MNFIQWEIVYIKFPFTNLSNYKLRPALIISNDTYNKKDNLIFIWIFWNEWIQDFSLPVDESDLESWKMLKQSFLRFQNIFTLDKDLVERKVWKLQKEKLIIIDKKLRNYIKIT